MKTNISLKENKGFTLLFAVIVSTLVLAVGGSIINIALKQVILSGIGRESQYAFYAASTGLECAYYLDIKGIEGGGAAFATSSDFESALLEEGCAGTENIYDELPVTDEIHPGFSVDSGPNPIISSFRLQNFSDIEGDKLDYCADVLVKKYITNGLVSKTEIESRGYNTCDTNNPRRIERGLKIDY